MKLLKNLKLHIFVLLIFAFCIIAGTKKDLSLNDIKALEDIQLVAIIRKELRGATSSTNQKIWNTLSKGLCELYMRPYARDHISEIDELREEMQQRSSLCVIDGRYSLEVVGIQERHKEQRVHPYPRSPVAKYVIEKWQNSTINESLDRYINCYLSKQDKKRLFHKKVYYLSKAERARYLVTFEQ